jgi:outer membrane protein assembly factor BamB
VNRILLALTCLILTWASTLADWPGWLGPNRDGLSPEKELPVTWSQTENLRWKVAVPGAGVSAPIVWRDRVFVTSSTGKSGEHLHLFCFHRDDGRRLWERRFFGSELSEGQFSPGGMAVPTPATDGKRVYALYGTGDLVCVDMEGKPVWIRSLAREYGPFRNRWGMASSPLLVEGLLVVQVDHWGKSYLLAVDAALGVTRWRTRRDAAVNWTSPVAMRIGKKTLIVAAGTRTLKGYDIEGHQLWSLGGLHAECISTPVARRDRLWLACGRDMTSLFVRVRQEQDGKVTARQEWKVASKGVGIPTPVCVGDYLYCAEDAGWAVCRRADSGKQVWRRRLGGKVQASPVAGAGKLYFAGINGTVTVLRAGPEFKVLAKNDMGESMVASPALSGGCIVLRGEKHLFCVGARSKARRER